MTNQEILEKAIQKAIDGGWRPVDKEFEWRVIDPLNTAPYLSVLFAVVDTSSFDGDNVASKKFTINEVIFNHDFARSLWSDRPEFEVNLVDIPAWQYHLQMMVVEPNPIAYLGEHM